MTENSSQHLVTRNVRIAGRRTSIRLEPALWEAFDNVCAQERIRKNKLIELVAEENAGNQGLTSSVRVFLVAYYASLSAARGALGSPSFLKALGEVGETAARLVDAKKQPPPKGLLSAGNKKED